MPLPINQLGIEPIARPINLDGTSTYRGYLFVRRDSRILTASDMRGKRFAFVERSTSAGYLFPLAYFKAHHVEDVHAYLGETFFSGSHDAAILAVLNRDADVGAAKSTIYDQLKKENPRIGTELQVLSLVRGVSAELLCRAQGPRFKIKNSTEAGFARYGEG